MVSATRNRGSLSSFIPRTFFTPIRKRRKLEANFMASESLFSSYYQSHQKQLSHGVLSGLINIAIEFLHSDSNFYELDCRGITLAMTELFINHES